LETALTLSRGIKEDLVEFRREKILDAASQLFFERGYNGTTIDDIAARIGVTKPFIYNRFTNKSELLTEVCNRTTAYAADLAQTARDSEGSARDRLFRFGRDLTLRVIEGRIYLSVLFREEKHLSSESLAALKRDRRRFNAALTALLEEGRKAGEFHFGSVEVALQAITGMTTWTFTWYQPTSAMAADRVADEMGQLVLQAAGAR
jgi:TetR/AcrR family transcriptional regulator, cholesterol catabolism regulator